MTTSFRWLAVVLVLGEASATASAQQEPRREISRIAGDL